jgi:MinD-like ATPase involved in chromosome partitioning or flagellar assembly
MALKVPVLTALGESPWESDVITALDAAPSVTVVRRCVDVVELLALAATGLASCALVSADLRRFDADVFDRLRAAEVVVVGVIMREDAEAEQRLAVLGVRHFVPADAAGEVFATVLANAVETGAVEPSAHAFGDPSAATHAVIPPTGTAQPVRAPTERGSVIAVWGPTGAPGRTTVAVGLADELARLDRSALLIDADVYGGVIAATLGLLDESPGLAAACRSAGSSRLDAAGLAGLAWQLGPRLRVLTGIPRAERWPELRAAGVEAVLGAARGLAEFTVVDCGFAIEADEELSYDTVAPRRNGATLAVLAAADVIIAVGAADPIGLQRLIRGLVELREGEFEAPVWVVLNRVRAAVVPGKPEVELAAALQRFSGRSPAAFLPYDRAALDLALANGKTLAEARPKSPLRQRMVELAAALAGVAAGKGSRRRRRA